jgi:hypothetical protein
MKRIVFLTCIGSLALALTAWGAPRDRQAARSGKGKSAPSAHTVSARSGGHVVRHAAPTRTSRTFSASRSHQRAVTSPSRNSRVAAAKARSTRIANTRTASVARNRAAISRGRNLARANRVEAARVRNPRIAQSNARINARRNLAVNRERNLTLGRNVAINRARSAQIVNRWRSDRFRGSNYAAFYNYNRQWHDRGWWRSHHSRIVFVLGGWWYWNAGYWYPAWGYDPYAYYPYDGPIYGYGDLTPDRIIVNVQVALQEQGYYAGAVDGDLGPQTRGALAAFQADHGLAVTSAVDGPTLQTLGLA